MKNLFLLVTFLFLIHKQIIAQPVGWDWAQSVTGNNGTYGGNITTDVFTNVYVTGTYNGTLSLGTTTLSSGSGLGSMYLVKYDASGNLLWAKTQTGTGSAGGVGVSTDLNGNVFVIGSFSSPSVIFGTYTLTSTAYSNLFIVKFDSNGNVLWAKSAGGTFLTGWNGVSVDSNGNALVTGYFGSASITIGTYTLSNPSSNRDVFIVKYDPNGNVLWAKAAGGSAGGPTVGLSAYGMSIATDANGYALVTGYFHNSPIIFGTYTLSNVMGAISLFVAKYDPNGNVLWAKSAGGTIGDIGAAISTDSNGNVFLTGSYQSPSIVFGTYTLSNNNTFQANIFVTKYDASGNVLWAKSLLASVGAGSADLGICIDVGGHAFVTGYYNSPTIVFGASTIINKGGYDIFVAEYDTFGNELTLVSAGGSLNDYGLGIASDGGGNVFVTGAYQSPAAIFDNTTLYNADTTHSDVFVGRLQSCNPCLGIANLTSQKSTLSVYPNPCQDKLLVSNGEFKMDKIIISNLVGEIILEKSNCDTSQNIDLSGSPSGIYFLKVESENEINVIKFIKE